MKAGLEIHQQLATGKLFCRCPAELSEEVLATFHRRLRATGGENHAVDAAAEFQAARGLEYTYEVTPTSCLVEVDEEPPRALDRDAVHVALRVALALHARPVDEIQVMRKIVVDGSNTTGFQRTALVAVDGRLSIGERTYSIPSICLEEDAARRVGEGPAPVRFRLDRLGMPLIEVATGPEISSGEEARAVAEEIGALLRATRQVRRGIGTIREDLNVSTEGGARVEMKGVQQLRLVARYVNHEEVRQRHLLQVAAELRRRGAHAPDSDGLEVTHLLDAGGPGALGEILRKGGVVLALPLPGFAGALRGEEGLDERLGRELADHARSAGVRGLLHSDELPNRAVDQPSVDRLLSELHLGPSDAFVLIASLDPEQSRLALERVRRRATAAISGVPEETRDPLPDGRTRYSRPLPGRDRMYPETDVVPIRVGPELLARLSTELPELPAVTRARLRERFALGEEVAAQLLRSGELERFERLVGWGRPPALVARLLVHDLPTVTPEPEGDRVPPELSDESLNEVLTAVEAGEFSKEGIPAVLRALADGAPNVRAASERIGLQGGRPEELERLAEEVVRANARLVEERGAAAFSPLMGDLMKKVRGRFDGEAVARILKTVLDRALAKPGAHAPSP